MTPKGVFYLIMKGNTMKWSKLTNTEILTIELEGNSVPDKASAILIMFKEYKQGFISIEYQNVYEMFYGIEDALKSIIRL